MTKEKIKSFDFIRAFCTVGIVLFHYSYNYIEYGISGSHLWFNKYPRGDWGGLFVAIFFMLSGAVLNYNYGDKRLDIRGICHFYYKRWLSIFPMFYVAWFFGYLSKARELGTYLWGGPRRNFIYTILGIDGYLLNPGVNINYYTLGEWFLGAILILYLLFPILKVIIGSPAKYAFTVILAVVYTCNLYFDWFAISDGKNILTCLMDFWIGMLLIGYKDRFKNKICSAISAALAIVFMVAPLGLKEIMVSTIVAMLWMICIMYIGERLMEIGAVAFIAGIFSKYSFGIFLVHHVILYKIMKLFEGGSVSFIESVGLFILILLVITLSGGLLSLWGSLAGKAIDTVVSKIKNRSGK